MKTHCEELLATKSVILIYEKIVNFYLISCNELLDNKDFDSQINLTQFSKNMQALVDCYAQASSMLSDLYSEEMKYVEGDEELSV